MVFLQNHLGELYALCTAIFWTATALAFESASLKVGSVSVNIIRLLLGFLFLSMFTLISRSRFLPLDASTYHWIWLSLSGVVGFVIGDLFLFKSYTIIGSRFAMLIMALVPPLAAFFGFLILRERISFLSYTGMVLTVGGIAIAIISREDKKSKFSLKLPVKGVLYAFGGAAGQALGLVLSKLGMEGYDPFAATQIRIIAGIAGFCILVSFMRRWKKVYEALFHLKAMQGIALGSFFGPFLGVSFSLLAVAHTQTGIASTIMAIVPVLIIAPAIIVYKQKVTPLEILGAIISVSGVAFFFIV
ncbi:hypothetical protein ES708_09744 [subsurface metagenome]